MLTTTHTDSKPIPATGAPSVMPPQRSPSGARRLWAIVALLAALGSAFVIGRTMDSDSTPAVEPAAETEPEISPTVPGSASAIPDGTSRVAAVAQAAAPSVVQLETDGGLGSGVIYDESGLILTAAHVVATNESVAVRLADGRLFEGEIVGRHERTDIAVIRIDVPDPLPAAVLGYNDQLQAGELAVALGSPFGLDQTVTAGVVSTVTRMVNGVPMVQTDAAINPGNSGGPLLDANARVMGINDVIFTEGGRCRSI